MAVQVEIWEKDLKEELFANDKWMMHLNNRDENVLGGKVVHISQSGEASEAEKNRTVYPVDAVERGDTDITYAIGTYTTVPRHITNADTIELAYDKRRSLVRQDTRKVRQLAAEDLMFDYLSRVPAASVVASSGSDYAAGAPGASGVRKGMGYEDILNAMTVLDEQDVPMEERFLLLSAIDYNRLMLDSDVKDSFQAIVDKERGIIGQLHGFNLMKRSRLLNIAADNTVKTSTAASAADDSTLSLFWQKDFLDRAMGDVKMFDNPGRADYHGDIISFLLRFGGRPNREDNKGFGLIRKTIV